MTKKNISAEELTVPVLLGRLERISNGDLQGGISFDGEIKGLTYVSRNVTPFMFSVFLKIYCSNFRVHLKRELKDNKDKYSLSIYQDDERGKRISEIGASYVLKNL